MNKAFLRYCKKWPATPRATCLHPPTIFFYFHEICIAHLRIFTAAAAHIEMITQCRSMSRQRVTKPPRLRAIRTLAYHPLYFTAPLLFSIYTRGTVWYRAQPFFRSRLANMDSIQAYTTARTVS